MLQQPVPPRELLQILGAVAPDRLNYNSAKLNHLVSSTMCQHSDVAFLAGEVYGEVIFLQLLYPLCQFSLWLLEVMQPSQGTVVSLQSKV